MPLQQRLQARPTLIPASTGTVTPGIEAMRRGGSIRLLRRSDDRAGILRDGRCVP
jgi:hypothetical protein